MPNEPDVRFETEASGEFLRRQDVRFITQYAEFNEAMDACEVGDVDGVDRSVEELSDELRMLYLDYAGDGDVDRDELLQRAVVVRQQLSAALLESGALDEISSLGEFSWEGGMPTNWEAFVTEDVALCMEAQFEGGTGARSYARYWMEILPAIDPAERAEMSGEELAEEFYRIYDGVNEIAVRNFEGYEILGVEYDAEMKDLLGEDYDLDNSENVYDIKRIRPRMVELYQGYLLTSDVNERMDLRMRMAACRRLEMAHLAKEGIYQGEIEEGVETRVQMFDEMSASGMNEERLVELFAWEARMRLGRDDSSEAVLVRVRGV